jgi:protein-S-isoprenylcysteine O-methyltransferase Ste14
VGRSSNQTTRATRPTPSIAPYVDRLEVHILATYSRQNTREIGLWVVIGATRESSSALFLRDRVPSEAERKVARGIRTGHFVAMVAFAGFLNVSVALHLVRFGLSSEWVWIQIFGVVVLLAAVGGLIWVIKKSSARSGHGNV